MDNYPKAYLYRRIVQAKLYIDRCYAEAIDIANIADEAFFSKYHFIRQFKKIYGKTPHQYLTKVRVEKAMEYLQARHSVLDTCHLVGYDSVTSFSTLFKKIVGKSPSAYALQEQERRAQCEAEPLQFVPGCFARTKEWVQKSNFQEAEH